MNDNEEIWTVLINKRNTTVFFAIGHPHSVS